MCPCSPDVGDCPRCKNSDGTKKLWIQDIVGHMKEGTFTKQALKKHMTPEEFAHEVKKHPKQYAMKTRRRAQFLRNIRRKTPRKK